MKITVVVPTYCRPTDLARCLEALKQQTRPADELLTIVRDTDTDTWKFLETFNPSPLPLRIVTVSIPGLSAALNTGLDAATGDIIAFTDDDAAPHTDWLARIEAHFSLDERVGAVGGRDFVYKGTRLLEGSSRVVGQVQWFGRVVGNHCLGIGEPREVDVLKGVNMSYRRAAVMSRCFDRRMRGTSVQTHTEIEFCLALKAAGWKLVYDPLIAVDHYVGQRFDEEQRDQFNAIAINNIVHNKTLALLEHLPPVRRVVFLVWAVLIGTRAEPGFIQWLRFLPSEGKLAGQKWLASMQGIWQGWQTWQASRVSKST